MVRNITKALKDETDINYSETILNAEKLLEIDERKPNDFLAMDFTAASISKLKTEISKYKAVNLQGFNEIRKLVIEESLEKYKRDYTNLTTLFLGWGGNCVTQTLLFASLLKDLKFEDGYQVGIANFTDHIETVIYNDQNIVYTVSGKAVAREDAILFKPEILLIGILDSLKVKHNFKVDGFEIGERSESADASAKTGVESLNLKSMAMTLFKKMKRKGILENSTLNTAKNTWTGEKSRLSEEDPPESSTISFTDIHKDTKNSWDDIVPIISPKSSIAIQINLEADPKSYSKAEYRIEEYPNALDKDKLLKTYFVTAKDEATYYKLQRIKRQSKNNPDNVTEAIHLMKLQAVNKLFSEPEFHKYFLSHDNLPVHYKKYSDDDIARIRYYRNILSEFKNGGHICIGFNGYIPEPCLAKKYNNVNLKFLTQNFWPVMWRDEDMIIYAKYNPEKFVKTYSELSLSARKLITEMLRNQEFSSQRPSPVVFSRIQSYLNRIPLESIQIVNTVKPRTCLPYSGQKIQLPVSQTNLNGFFVYEQGESADCKQSKNPSEEKETPTNAVESTITAKKSADATKMELNVLIELTVGFGGGFQLWDKNVGDALLNNSYEPTVYGRKYDVAAMRQMMAVKQINPHPDLESFRLQLRKTRSRN